MIRREPLSGSEEVTVLSLEELNGATAQAFAAALEGIYEHSPWIAQRAAACEAQFKALVALGTVGEPALRARLEPAGASPADVPGAPGFALAALPAEVLRQRPDIAAAERELAAASAAIGVQEAQLYPSLSLFGNILPSRSVLDGSPAQSLRTWTFGPSLNLPLFDAGSRQANLEAARSAFVAAQAGHQARVRLAVREIEEALVRLEAAGERLAQSAEILKAQTEIVAATERRVRAGLSARTELLEVQRAELAAQGLLVAARFEQSSAWVQLYRAAGGGWDGRLAPSVSPETPRS
jgi:outer membrane protein TolC